MGREEIVIKLVLTFDGISVNIAFYITANDRAVIY
jgi:hypothetical protein